MTQTQLWTPGAGRAGAAAGRLSAATAPASSDERPPTSNAIRRVSWGARPAYHVCHVRPGVPHTRVPPLIFRRFAPKYQALAAHSSWSSGSFRYSPWPSPAAVAELSRRRKSDNGSSRSFVAVQATAPSANS